MNITIFRLATGEILCNTSINNIDNLVLHDSEGYIEGEYSDSDYYININNNFTPEPKLNFNLTVNTNIVTNIPDGTEVHIPELGNKYTIIGGTMEFNPLNLYTGSVHTIFYKPCYNRLALDVPIG